MLVNIDKINNIPFPTLSHSNIHVIKSNLLKNYSYEAYKDIRTKSTNFRQKKMNAKNERNEFISTSSVGKRTAFVCVYEKFTVKTKIR